ncbi:hypothetical protein OAE72_00700 [Akkermansiaceae bacterium]|nr:hypothetical protein [Akkermansiaceae bacterium]
MAIFRGTGGSGSSSDSTIVDAVTAQATIATTKAGEASTSATTATTKASEASTSATTATTKASEASTSATTASTKATEATTAKTGAETAQTAAEAARDAALGHSNTANSSAVQTVAGSNTQVVGVYNNIANVNTVAGVNTDVTTVAGISSDVTTVAADASDIGTVSTNIANVNNVGNNIANVNAVHGNASNINTVAADGTDIGTVSSNIANVNTVAGISSNVTTVAGLESKMDTVIADASDIGAVAGNIGDVTTVAGINSDVDTVAGIAAKVTTVADNITDVQNADTNATNAATSASNASASATSASNSATTATTKATEASNSATAASNSATTATTKASQAAGSATTAGTSASTATTKASEASASATTATTKAGEAASSASAASGSATTAVTKASEASVSAASAATSATNSSNAASTWNDFYTTYLGAADAPPTVDVQGNALQTGAFYYDTGAGSNTVGLYVYNGSSWVYSTNYNNVTAPYSLAQDLATNSHDINFGDNAKAKFGASDDLQIYHDGSNSYIKDSGTGTLRLQGSSSILMQKLDGEIMMIAREDGAVELNHNGSTKLATTNTGIDVTGTVTADGIVHTGDTDTFIKFIDNRIYAERGGVRVLDCETNSSKINSYDSVFIQTGTTTKNRIKVNQGGDISFYEDTGTTPKFFWDASAERLGIGTASPSTALDVVGSYGTTPVKLLRHGDNGSVVTLGRNGVDAGVTLDYPASNTLGISTNGSERMRIDSSGNVGIGTSSPDGKLHVYTSDSGATVNSNADDLVIESATNAGISILGDGNETQYLMFGDAANSAVGRLQYSHIDNHMGLYTSGSERMRIDSSGNLLVGTTSQISSGKLSVAGGASANGITATTAATAGYAAASFQRTDSDGELIGFKKGANNVGSIGTYSGALIVGNASRGLKIETDKITPRDSDNTDADSVIDLGSSGSKFKDLYLSGGVHLGGTGTANKLDDYEEGTWTPAFAGPSAVTYTQQSGRYTKVGREVHVQAVIRWSALTAGVSNVSLGGLPFSVGGTDNFINTLDVTYANNTNFTYINEYLSGGTMFFYSGASSHGAASTNPYGSSGTILINGTFYTS